MAVGVSHTDNEIDHLITTFEDDNALPSNKDSLDIIYSNKTDSKVITKKTKTNFVDINKTPSKLKDNSILLCDNYYGIHELINEQKKPKLIYLDPPYATGMSFISRDQEYAYKDDMSNAQYLEYMRRRIILMREALDDDGSIYIHIGHQMVAHMKILMDQIFGESNFKNIITRRKCSSKNYTKNQYANIHDYILFYTKSKNYVWNQPGETPDKEWINKEYNKEDSNGRYKLVPIHAPGTRNGSTGDEWNGMLPPKGKHWQYTPDKLTELNNNGFIHWSKTGNPRRKVYLTKDKKISLSDYWLNYRDAHHQSIKITGYPTEKNLDMLKMIVRASSNQDDLVLDPFCGSGTTLHAARDENRKWIGMDKSIQAIKTSLIRMNEGMDIMGDYVNEKQKNMKQASLFQENNKATILIDSQSKNIDEIIRKLTK